MSKDLHLQFDPDVGEGYSPYRVFDGAGNPVSWINNFLDAQAIRNFSLRSLRAYGFDLLNFSRWWFFSKQADLRSLTQSRLFEYVRYQLRAQSPPTPRTINHRLTVLRCLYRFHFGYDIPSGQSCPQKPSSRSFEYGRPAPRASGLKLKEPRRVVLPLSPDEVLDFWRSFRSYRDLSMVALMLANGLRSCEVLGLRCQDLILSQARICVRGKGNKERILPLYEDTLHALDWYLSLERPSTTAPHLFVSLKGAKRGQPMTPAGFRSLFRHHRKTSSVGRANPHRFRHTFGTDMVRAGVSLPALMHLMGHSSIRTTMLYIELSRQDVWEQYTVAVKKLHKLSLSKKP